MRFTYERTGHKKRYTFFSNFNSQWVPGMRGDFGNRDLSLINVEAELAIVMPGELVDHNATRQEGNRLIWSLPTESVMQIQATSEASALALRTIFLWAIFICLGTAFAIAIAARIRENSPDREKEDIPLRQRLFHSERVFEVLFAISLLLSIYSVASLIVWQNSTQTPILHLLLTLGTRYTNEVFYWIAPWLVGGLCFFMYIAIYLVSKMTHSFEKSRTSLLIVFIVGQIAFLVSLLPQ